MALKDLLILGRNSQAFQGIKARLDGGIGEQWVEGLSGSAKAHFLAYLHERSAVPFLFVTYDPEEGEKLYEDLLAFERPAHLFPSIEFYPYLVGPDKMVTKDRLVVLNKLAHKEPIIVVTMVEGLLQSIIPPELLKRHLLYLTKGQGIDYEGFINNLAEEGYKRVSLVEGIGEYSIRGGIIDVYSPLYDNPLRIELDGETVESIREFDLFSQRSIRDRVSAIISPESEFALSFQAKEEITLIDYFPKEAILILDEPERLKEEALQMERQSFGEDSKVDVHYLSFDEVLTKTRERKIIYTTLLSPSLPQGKRVNLTKIPSKSVGPFRGNFDLFLRELESWEKERYRIVVVCENLGQRDRLKEILEEYNYPLGKLAFEIGYLHSGYELPLLGLVLITDGDIFARYAKRHRLRKFKEGTPISSYRDLEVGDYVVHINHGIGIYGGIKTLKVDGWEGDYLLIYYADEDKLYVPCDQLDIIQKYIGREGEPPKIYRLGDSSWPQVKERVKKSVQNLAKELLGLYAARQVEKGHAFTKDSHWQREFEEAFIYEETPDQLQTIEEIKKDMERDKPMDRLVCGDVGYGKTEVAMRAAFKAVMDSKQVAFLAPTTILVEQHYHTFKERFAEYPINIAMLSRFKTPREQRRIIEGLKAGSVDIVIGTHRLLQKDIQFKDLGLVIIDEEQRFGVVHKERLKKLKKTVDVLTLSATPIPRTLHMSLTGLRDMSLINTPPEGRQPIQTYCLRYDERVIAQAIRRELDRGGQVFFVHNRIETIQRAASLVEKLVPTAKVAIAHGQMEERELEEVMINFIDKKIDVLVTTTIVESGLDIPNVNTIIIDRADTFGLAELYQLRGRVGRGRHKAYAYLLYPPYLLITETAQKRLKTIEEFSDLGSGFKIALRDLEIRGMGNILGPEQHGYLAAVGFDLYCQLLSQVVKELKGEEVIPEINPLINLKVDAYLPSDYINDEKQKVAFYKRMASIDSLEKVTDLEEELKDRYGDLPPPARMLLEILRIKVRAKKLNITQIGSKGGELLIEFKERTILPPDKLKLLLRNHHKEITLFSQKGYSLILKNRLGEKAALSLIRNILQELA